VVSNKAGVIGRAGAEARVIDVDQQNHTITVTDGMKTYTVDLKQNGQDLQVYHEKEMQIAKGDRIVFVKNDRGLSVKNGQVGTVKEITPDGKLTVQINKETRTFNVRSQYNYFDYGYVVTAYKSQGQTVDRVIYHADSQKANYNEAYVATTRGRHDMKVYTDSKSAFIEGIKQEQIKTSTLDFATDIKPDIKNVQKETHHDAFTTKEVLKTKITSEFQATPDKKSILGQIFNWDKISLISGVRTRQDIMTGKKEKIGSWHINYERDKGFVVEKRSKNWLGRPIIEKKAKNYVSRTEIKNKWLPLSWQAVTVSYNKKTGVLSFVKQDLTRNPITQKMTPIGQAEVKTINLEKLKKIAANDKKLQKMIAKIEKGKNLDQKHFNKLYEYAQKYEGKESRTSAVEKIAAKIMGSEKQSEKQMENAGRGR